VTHLPGTMPAPDDRDLLAGGSVDALVAAVYRDLGELEGEVLWAEQRADTAEGRLRRALERRARHPGPGTATRVAVDRCAHTAREHVDGAVAAAEAQAEAIVAEAHARAGQLLAAARAERPRAAQPDRSSPAATAPLAPAAGRPFVAPAPMPEGATLVRPTAPGSVTPPPAGATPRGPGPAPVGRSAPDLPAGDADFERFWAESEVAADTPGLLQSDGFARGLASTLAGVVVLLLLLLQLT
jgi:hypothetical protein